VQGEGLRVKRKSEVKSQRRGLIIAVGWFAEVFLGSVFGFVVEHTVFGTAGSAAFLAADFFVSLLSGGSFAIAEFFESFAEFASGDVAVEFAGALLLAFDFDAGGDVFEVNTGGGFVDFLTSVTTACDKFFDEGFRSDSKT